MTELGEPIELLSADGDVRSLTFALISHKLSLDAFCLRRTDAPGPTAALDP